MKHLIAEFDALRARFPAGFASSMVLPCLRRIQEDRGHVADSDIAELAQYLGVPRIQIEEVLSFYGQFRRAPVGHTFEPVDLLSRLLQMIVERRDKAWVADELRRRARPL